MTTAGGIKSHAAPGVMFFGIGAQKAGTSWIYEYLAGHPEVSGGPLKEYHYFSHFHRRLKAGAGYPAFFKLRRRLALASVLRRAHPELGRFGAFRAANGGTAQFLALVRGSDATARVCGDISPVYSLLDRTAFSEMLDCADDVRLIFVMRDPVARLWSQIRMTARRKGVFVDMAEPSVANMVAKLSVDREYIGRSDYARTISELEAAVPAERIHYMFYEDMFTAEAIAGLTSFLGISKQPADFGKFVHQGVAADMPEEWRRSARLRLDRVYRFVEKKFAGRVPASWDQGLPQHGTLDAGPANPKTAQKTAPKTAQKTAPKTPHSGNSEMKPTRHHRRAAFELAEV